VLNSRSTDTWTDSTRMKAQLVKRFEDEIRELELELKTQLPKEIQRAREHGDLRENAEYKPRRSARSTSRRASAC